MLVYADNDFCKVYMSIIIIINTIILSQNAT